MSIVKIELKYLGKVSTSVVFYTFLLLQTHTHTVYIYINLALGGKEAFSQEDFAC